MKELDDEEKRINKKHISKQQARKNTQYNSKECGNETLKELKQFAPKESFTQAYNIRYFKTFPWCFMDVYNEVTVFDEASLNVWKEFFVWGGKTNDIARFFLSA